MNNLISHKLVYRLLLLCFLYTPIAKTQTIELSSTQQAHLNSKISIALDNLQALGVLGSVVAFSAPNHDLKFHVNGYVDKTRSENISKDHLFLIGSQTKVFTAAAILLLENEGSLSLDDSIEKYLPSFSRSPKMTIKQLLHHTAGLGDSIKLFEDTAEAPNFKLSLEDHLLIGRAFGQEFKPGTKWNYNNLGFVLLGAIVEKVSGKKLNLFLRNNILKPLKLSHTFLGNLEQLPHSKMAIGYQKKEGSEELIDKSKPELSWASSAGDMLASTEDMHRWYRALNTANDTGLHLSDFNTTFVETKASSPLKYYGYGLMGRNVNGQILWGHGGYIHGYLSLTLTDPDTKNIISIMVNLEHFGDDLLPQLESTVALIYQLYSFAMIK